MRFLILLFFSFFVSLTHALPLHELKLPKGFSIEIYASPLPGARSMTLGTNDIVFVGSLATGNVYAVVPDAKSSNGTRILTIASNLDTPNGVAFHNGSLYVAEPKRILRFDDIENHLNNPPKPVVITTALPQDQADHRWRYIAFGPDNKLYVSIGVPCNVCLSSDSRFGTIMRMNPDGTQIETVVKGIRMSVGFDWDPNTHKFWFTHNGRDWMGDNIPPDNLNYASTVGIDFGFPYYVGKNMPDPTYGKLHPTYDFSPPTFDLPSHSAPLGMRFYNKNIFPSEYHDQLFIAEHGSWNRSTKIGYQVIAVKIATDHVIAAKPFVTGWLQDQKAWGRPVDVLVMRDGSLLISDDLAGVIYRVRYHTTH